MNIRDHDISIQDVIDCVLKKPAFGFDQYEPTPTHKYTFPVKTHVAAKAKRRMFCEEASKRADKIPAATKYQSAIDWNKNPESRNYKFNKTDRDTIADTIIKKSKKPEKCSPGPAAYNSYDNWKYNLAKPHGQYLQNKEKRITFMETQVWYAEQTPHMKYPDINPVSFYSKRFSSKLFFYYTNIAKIQGNNAAACSYRKRTGQIRTRSSEVQRQS